MQIFILGYLRIGDRGFGYLGRNSSFLLAKVIAFSYAFSFILRECIGKKWPYAIALSYWQRNKTEKLVSDILGVVNVINYLIVVPTELLTDQTVAENIQTALKNSPRIDGSAVKVSVKDGIVCLKGSVPTSHDRMQALIVVGNCREVIDVINEIRVL